MIPRLRFLSSCSTVTEIATVLEDRPVCRTERVESCLADSSCRLIKVNRCHVEKVSVRKGRPVTKCERIPRKLCAKVRADSGLSFVTHFGHYFLQWITLGQRRQRHIIHIIFS